MKAAFLILICAPAWAATYNAASCSESDVQAAYATEQASKADGDIIRIPSCSASWSTPWSISPTNSLTFQGNSTVVGDCRTAATCTATDNTVITDSVAGTAWSINTASLKSFRITGLTFNQSSGTPAYGAITIAGSSTAVRVDHNHFNDTTSGGHTINVDGIQGVVDHNFFDSTNQANSFALQFTNGGASGWGHEIWTQPDNFGTSQFLFVENNWFQNISFMYDCDNGGTLVARYNGVGFNTRIQTHGLTNKSTRGCRTEEIYQNTFTFSADPNSNSFAFLVMLESGTGMIWGNTLTGFTKLVQVDMKRTGGEPQTATPNGWGICGSSPVGGVSGPSNWDGNVSGQSGWPCMDSVGRGAGDLLSGCFQAISGGPCTQTVNTRTNGIAWPQQALVPAYAWANTINPNSYAPISYWVSQPQVVENRDYYLELPNVNEPSTFNGSAGIGAGTLVPTNASAYTNAPNCTTGVGYWNSANSTLYKCTSTNTWVSYYTPYTYPHPLTGAATSPTVTTTTASGITTTAATSGGTVTSNGGASVTSEGVCYATTANPTTPCTSDGTATPFTSSLTSLSTGTVYHYRSFATNSVGTSFGSDLTFTTLSPAVAAVASGAVLVIGVFR